MKKRKKDTLLWKVTHKDSGTVSYIFGTIHLNDNRVYYRLDEVKDYIDKSDVFIAEYSLDDRNDYDIMEAMQLPEGKHIKSYMSTNKYERLKKAIYKSFKIDLERLGFFRPMVIENMLSVSIFENDFEFPMDVILWNYAIEKGKIAIGAETTKSQILIMKNWPVKQQIKSLLDIGKNPKKYRKKMKKLVGLYEKQDVRQLHKKTLKSLGNMKDVLVNKRNKRMVETFDQYAGDKKVFLAVGAGHFFGGKGILRLLKARGYKVKPVL